MIEAKDWKLENIQSMDKLTATLQVDGREVRKSNPLEQAKQYAFGVCRLLESDPALVGEPGTSFQGKLVIPWGYGVAFAGTELGNVIPPERVICQDEMVESVDAKAFQQRLWKTPGQICVEFNGAAASSSASCMRCECTWTAAFKLYILPVPHRIALL